ncbi:MAG: hypothetical protein AB7G88_12045, partial [Thermomicrobiales bacterium]
EVQWRLLRELARQLWTKKSSFARRVESVVEACGSGRTGRKDARRSAEMSMELRVPSYERAAR